MKTPAKATRVANTALWRWQNRLDRNGVIRERAHRDMVTAMEDPVTPEARARRVGMLLHDLIDDVDDPIFEYAATGVSGKLLAAVN